MLPLKRTPEGYPPTNHSQGSPSSRSGLGGSLEMGESWRGLPPWQETNPSLLGGSLGDTKTANPPNGVQAKTRRFLGDIRGTHRQAPVNQRPAG